MSSDHSACEFHEKGGNSFSRNNDAACQLESIQHRENVFLLPKFTHREIAILPKFTHAASRSSMERGRQRRRRGANTASIAGVGRRCEAEVLPKILMFLSNI